MTPNLPVTHCLGRWWFCAVHDEVRRVECAWSLPRHHECGPVRVERIEEEERTNG